MPDLALKLAANGFILLIAAIGWGLENKWQDRRTRARRRWARCLIVLIFAGSIVGATVTLHSHSKEQEQQERITRIDQSVVELVKLARERDPNLTEQEALSNINTEVRTLRRRTSKLERELDGVKRYGNVAELNAFGLSGRIRAGSGLKETSSISQALEGAYIRKEDGRQVRYLPDCNDAGIAAFRKTAEINPDFPFSHWALALCAAKAGDKEWRKYAERAVTILEHTTQIAGHHGHHDNVLEQLRKLLAR